MTQSANIVRVANPRWRKELRMLLLPGVVAAMAACLVPVFALFEYNAPGEGIFGFLKGFAWLGFLGCILLIASAPLGWEYQHRTLSMLLAQPFTRSQLWKEKMLAPVVWTVSLCL